MSRIGRAIRASREGPPKWGPSYLLAERAGVSPQYITDIELGRRIPPMGTLLRIAHALPDVSTGEWLWMLLADLWSPEIAHLMKLHAITEQARAARPAVGKGES